MGVFLHAPCWNRSCRSSVGESLLHAPCCNLSRRQAVQEFLLHAPRWKLFHRPSVGESLLHAPCLYVLVSVRVSLCYIPREGICRFVRRLGVSLKGPVLDSVSSFGRWGVSLTSPVLESVWSYIGWGVYLTRPVLDSVSSFGESLLHAPCWNWSRPQAVGEILLKA